MKRNFKLGLILGIAILMLLPVYARAQMSLNSLQNCIAGGTVANITASQGAVISFVVTSSLSNPQFSRILDPDLGVTQFSNGIFTWTTGGSNPVAAGSYLAAFEATNGGTEVEQLVVMITINSATSTSPPAETITVSFSNPTTTGTSGQPVSFTASATSSLGHPLQYNFIWGDGTSTGFGSASTQSHTYNTTTTYTYTVTVQAKCPTDNVSASASTSITITGSGGGGGGGSGSGTLTNPYKINKTALGYSVYIPQNAPDGSRGLITIPAGSKVYFEVDPVGTTGRSVSAFAVSVKFYSGAGTICKLTQDKTTGAYSSEACQGSDSFMDIVYNGQPYPIANKKFLYAVDNSLSTGVASDEIWATIP